MRARGGINTIDVQAKKKVRGLFLITSVFYSVDMTTRPLTVRQAIVYPSILHPAFVWTNNNTNDEFNDDAVTQRTHMHFFALVVFEN